MKHLQMIQLFGNSKEDVEKTKKKIVEDANNLRYVHLRNDVFSLLSSG